MSNWTPEMVAQLRAAAPLDFSKAQKMAGDLGVSARSIVAKAISEGVEYVKAEKAAKKRTTTKADLVESLESLYGESLEGMGFDKMNARGLAFLITRAQRDASEDSDA